MASVCQALAAPDCTRGAAGRCLFGSIRLAAGRTLHVQAATRRLARA